MNYFHSENTHPSPKKFVRTDEATQDEIKQMTNMISANDWRDRHRGIERLLAMCETHPDVVGVNIVKV